MYLATINFEFGGKERKSEIVTKHRNAATFAKLDKDFRARGETILSVDFEELADDHPLAIMVTPFTA